jgi:hypothetical protein
MMVAGLLAFHSLIPVMEVLLTVCFGFVVGAVSYLGGCLLLPGSRSDLHGAFEAIKASLSGRRTKNTVA